MLPVYSQPDGLMAMTADGKVTAWGAYCPGVLGMARENTPDSANSQFFFMRDAYPALEKRYTAFGRVLSGQDVVRADQGGRAGRAAAGPDGEGAPRQRHASRRAPEGPAARPRQRRLQGPDREGADRARGGPLRLRPGARRPRRLTGRCGSRHRAGFAGGARARRAQLPAQHRRRADDRPDRAGGARGRGRRSSTSASAATAAWVEHTYAAQTRGRAHRHAGRAAGDRAARLHDCRPARTIWTTYLARASACGPRWTTWRTFTLDNPQQQAFVAELRGLLAQKMRRCATPIELAHAGDLAEGAAATSSSGRTATSPSGCASMFAAMAQEERRLARRSRAGRAAHAPPPCSA